MTTKTDLSKYTVNVQGKDFITFPGLLAEAHARGLTEIKTELVNEDLTNPVVKATVTMRTGDITVPSVFTGYGDANANNVAKKVVGALLRMAETRAIARALRFACNIDMAALEELDAEENVISKTSGPKKFSAPPQVETSSTKVENEVVEVVPTAQETAKRSFGQRKFVQKSEPKF